MTLQNASPTVARGASGKAGGRLAQISTPIVHHKRPASQSPNYLLAQALRYALAGWRVLPLVPNGKAPAIPAAHGKNDPLRGKCKGECGRPGHGVHDATDDPETIGAWWRRWPAANIGLALGDDLVTFDVDPRNGGQLDALARWLGVDPSDTVTQRTAGGGWHVLYQKPHGWALAGAIPNVPGVDVLSGDRYIVASPSTVDGKPYAWQRDPLDGEPARIPLDLAERLRKTTPAARTDAQNSPTAAQSGPRGNVPPFHVVEHALAHLDPWAGDYSWWLSNGMALHSAYPGEDGFALWAAWCDGLPGEAEAKWNSFDVAGGVTIATLLHHAKQAGWRPELATPDAPTRETAHDVLHAQLKPSGGKCPICGKRFLERAPVGDVIRGRTRVMACHKRDCETWQAWRVENKILERQPWTWAAWFVVEVEDGKPWRKLVNGGPLSEREDYIGAPTIRGTVALFTGFALPGSVAISMQNMLEMAAEYMLAMPDVTPGKRLRTPNVAARAKRAAAVVEDVQPQPEPVQWRRWSFGLDLLSDVDAWTVLAIIEKHGGTVDPRGNFSYPVALDGAICAAVAAWMKPQRDELDLSAYSPAAGKYASKSGFVPLPEQAAWPDMPETQRRLARLRLHGDTNHAHIAREAARM